MAGTASARSAIPVGAGVYLNADALRAIESLKQPLHRASDPIFGASSDYRVDSTHDPGSNHVWKSKDYELRLALKPAHILFMVGDGRPSIKEIQELAGHKTITMSARYSHLSPEHKLSVIERIATAHQ